MAATPGTFDYAIPSQWGTGFVAQWSFTPDETVERWQVTIRFDGDLVNVWNAEVIAREGDTITLASLDYNSRLAAGQTTGFGFQASGTDTAIEVVGGEDGGSGGGEPPVPVFAVSDASASEGDPATEPPAGDGPLALPLSTSGARIVDADGRTVDVAGVSWFGGETTRGAPDGLFTRNWRDMIDQIADTGFNLIRLPFSSTAVTTDFQPNDIDYRINPDLAGLTTLEVFDRIVDYAAEKDLMILLDNHRVTPGDGPSGRWTDGSFSEDDFVAMWQMLAARYADDPNVIGADLHNEPHLATWAEWSAAAERAGNAIHAIDEDWLIVVEGVAQYRNDYYWWGGQLKGVRDDPVVLATPGKLVYSPHDYPPSVFNQPWFNDGSDLIGTFRDYWGFIFEEGIAPVVIGEMGSRLQGEGDLRWFEAIRDYIIGDADGDGTSDRPAGAAGPGFIWWSWNPNSGDTGGILTDDWTTVDQNKLAAIGPLLEGSSGAGLAEGTTVTFTVTLAEPLGETVSVDYATQDGTALAGSDYEATSGRLVFAPGETRKTVAVTILADEEPEPDETFTLQLETSSTSLSATGTIVDDDDEEEDDGGGDPPPPPPPPEPDPELSIADATVGEEAGSVPLTLSLDRAAPAPVTVTYETVDGTAQAGEDYAASAGSFTIPAGTTTGEITLELVDDDRVEETESFQVRLLSADGADIADGEATVTVTDSDTPPPPPPPGDGATAEVAVVNDWQSGAQVALTLTNAGSTAVDGWTLAFDAPFPITQLWGGSLALAGEAATVTPLSWNARLEPGQSAEIGFLTSDGPDFDMAAWAASTTVDVILA